MQNPYRHSASRRKIVDRIFVLHCRMRKMYKKLFDFLPAVDRQLCVYERKSSDNFQVKSAMIRVGRAENSREPEFEP